MIEIIRAVVRQIKNKKFRMIWKYIVDPVFRTECNELIAIKSELSGKKRQKLVPLTHVMFGHKVVYPKWVSILEDRMESGIDAIPPIDVVELIPGMYITVDGNHRLSAMRNRLKPYQSVLVNVLERRTS